MSDFGVFVDLESIVILYFDYMDVDIVWEHEEENVSATEDEITSDKFEGMWVLAVDEQS